LEQEPEDLIGEDNLGEVIERMQPSKALMFQKPYKRLLFKFISEDSLFYVSNSPAWG